jgi:hypothetical protein
MSAAGSDRRGLYDDFRGYRIPTDDELDEALRAATVVVDANVLLSLYRYNETTRDDLLDVLRRLGDRLWVPHQTLREFWRNRLAVMSSRGAGDQILTTLEKQERAAVDAIQQWAKVTAVAANQRDALVQRVHDLHAELERTVRGHSPTASGVNAGAMREPVLQALETLLEGRVGPEPDRDAWKSAVAEGKARVQRRQPPGFLDADKVDSDLPEGPAGDYLVWKQSIDEVARRGGDLLIVTGDEKEDWWWRFRSEFIGPRQELVTELAALCGARLFMMRPTDLLRRASVLQVTVSTESVDEAARVSRVASRPTWTEAGVTALLEALDDEGQDQALVIRAAAASGGQIDREAIYELCDYEDDRMLRGFTRPTARITRDLQAEGIVAPDVEPALTPVYVGVKAAAFRIPSEMVNILTGRLAASDDEYETG